MLKQGSPSDLVLPGDAVKHGRVRPEEVPPPIPDKGIRETITADVVVVGAGVAGLSAALSASRAGAKTVVLEKGTTYMAHGLHNAAISSRLQRAAGIEIDKNQLIHTIMEFGAYRSDQRIVKLWADHCDEVMDWILDMAEVAQVEVVLDPTTKPWYFPNYPTAHVFMGGPQITLPKGAMRNAILAEMLLRNAQAAGVEFYFETPAVRLLREGNGPVTGVVAQTSRGDYLRFAARKGVVLCTGDYGNNPEMVKRYCDWRPSASLGSIYEPRLNTGDGHRMALWIGAALDDPPHCVMFFDFAVWGEFFNLARQPWLYVNLRGERFMNEDLPWGYECAQILQQPGRTAWAVWDAKYDREWPRMKSQCCKNMGAPTYLWNPSQLDDAIRKGNVLVAATIEELAAKMGVPVETFRATVARYNELARLGEDLDFGKHPDRLTSVEKPPFYAARMGSVYLVTLGGLKVNIRLQVLDAEGNAIPGLYAAGNVSGSFFGNVYPTTIPGLSHSRAWTFGRLAGLNAAGATERGDTATGALRD
ncbi:MAG: FAD-dependent oxidoreductase [Anaerolineae bacterium]